MCAFNELEQAVIEKMLSGKSPVIDTLRKQVRGGKILKREFTGVGFYTSIEPDTSAAPVSENLRISNVHAEIDGLRFGAGFVLFVEDGYARILEGFTYRKLPLNLKRAKGELLPYLANGGSQCASLSFQSIR